MRNAGLDEAQAGIKISGRNINRYAGEEATVTTGHGTTDWFQIGKGVSTSRLYIVTLLI